jgi:hypothetical protein
MTLFFIKLVFQDKFMIDRQTLYGNEEDRIQEILSRAVSLFRKTGLTELAEKWDKILKTYSLKKTLA